MLLDETLSMDRQLAEVKQKCSWTMMNLRKMSSYLDESLKNRVIEAAGYIKAGFFLYFLLNFVLLIIAMPST